MRILIKTQTKAKRSPKAEQTRRTKSFRRNMTEGEATMSRAMFSTVFSTATAVSQPASACRRGQCFSIKLLSALGSFIHICSLYTPWSETKWPKNTGLAPSVLF